MREDDNCGNEAAYERSSSSSSEDGTDNPKLMNIPRMTATVSAQPALRNTMRSQSSEEFSLSLKHRVSAFD